MNKINNFMYMIAAVFVSNLVYLVYGVQNAAYAAETCTHMYTYRGTYDRGYLQNAAACTTDCNAMVVNPDKIIKYSFNPSNGRCLCYYTEINKATGTYTDETYGMCGRKRGCVVVYSPSYDVGIITETMSTGVECNSDNGYYGGYMSIATGVSNGITMYVTSCICCPCVGADPKGESCLGSQNSAPYASMIRVMAKPGATAISDCYVVGDAYDQTGLYEYTDTDKCYYKTDTGWVPGPGIPVGPGTGIPVGPGGVEVATSIVP